MTDEIGGAKRLIATTEEAGRTCPYCRFPLKEGGELAFCTGCRSAHHLDCWADNSGCAVLGCVQAPGKTPPSHAAAPLPAAATSLRFSPTPGATWTQRFSTDDWIVLTVGLLLVVDLIALPWFSFGSSSFTVSFAATDAPAGWAAVLALLVTLALGADLLIERLAPGLQLPLLGPSRAFTRFVLSVAAAVFVGLKFLMHVHFSWFGAGFWLAVILTAGLVAGTRRLSNGHAILPNR
jgi:hypothetical protein